MAASTLTSKGQITLPREIRERLRLAQGDKVVFTVHPSGEVVVRRAGSEPDALAGLLRHLAGPRPVSVEAMNEAIRQRMKARYARGPKGK
jgi:AbrB family looped-hinge helix DNA binding protein